MLTTRRSYPAHLDSALGLLDICYDSDGDDLTTATSLKRSPMVNPSTGSRAWL